MDGPMSARSKILVAAATALAALLAFVLDAGFTAAVLIVFGPPVAFNLWLRSTRRARPWVIVLVAGCFYPGLVLAVIVIAGEQPFSTTSDVPVFSVVTTLLMISMYGLVQLRSSWWAQGLIPVGLVMIGRPMSEFFDQLDSFPPDRVLAALVLLVVACALFARRRVAVGGGRSLGFAVAAAAGVLLVLAVPARSRVSLDRLTYVFDPVLTPAGDLLFGAHEERGLGPGAGAFLILEKGTRAPRVLHDHFGRPVAIAPDGSTLGWLDYSIPISWLWGFVRDGGYSGDEVLAPAARGENARRIARVPFLSGRYALGPRGAFLRFTLEESVLESAGKRTTFDMFPIHEGTCFDDRTLYLRGFDTLLVVDLDRLEPRRSPLEAPPNRDAWPVLRCTAGSPGAWMVSPSNPGLGPQPHAWSVVPLGPGGPEAERTGIAPVVFVRNADGSIEELPVPGGAATPEDGGPWFGRRYGDVVVARGWKQLHWSVVGPAGITPITARGDVQLLPDSIVYAEKGGKRIVRYWPAEGRTEVLWAVGP